MNVTNLKARELVSRLDSCARTYVRAGAEFMQCGVTDGGQCASVGPACVQPVLRRGLEGWVGPVAAGKRGVCRGFTRVYHRFYKV